MGGCVLRVDADLLLDGTLFLPPIILMYSGWSFWVFRGKVRADIGYH
jgi:cytochrome bd ubiquinol oxidase subunit II